MCSIKAAVFESLHLVNGQAFMRFLQLSTPRCVLLFMFSPQGEINFSCFVVKAVDRRGGLDLESARANRHQTFVETLQ